VKSAGGINMDRVQIHWFRNDLRLVDLPALKESGKADYLLPVYVLDPRMYAMHALGFPKTGYFKVKFLLECLHDLQQQLKKKGSRLLVFIGYPEQILPDLAKRFSNFTITASKEYTHEELQVERKLSLSGLSIEYAHDLTLFHPEDLPFSQAQLPDVFTQFRKAVEQHSNVRSVISAPEWLPPVPEGMALMPIPSLSQLGIFGHDPEKGIAFAGGTGKGLERIQHYFFDTRQLSVYKETRNGLLGMDYSSKLSPWLSTGSLSPRMIWKEVKQYEAVVENNKSTYWLIFELLWRDYFKFIAMKYGRKLFLQEGIKGKRKPFSKDLQRFSAWCRGETGNDFVDANMKELRHTGFMSNRGRQNVASYLCKDLHIDWRYGAAWFESQLVDYDPASNWGNWMYIAGVGNDPREDRYFNTIKQADTYDSDRAYRSYWLENLKLKEFI
jgi:deoxyribodipyrimidine photo-lyase